MPGFLLHVGATVLCAHGGQAQPTAPNPRVLVSGQPTVDDDRARTWWRAARSRRAAADAVRHRAVDDGGNPRDQQRPAGAAAGQPGDLRAERHAAHDRHDPDAGDGGVVAPRLRASRVNIDFPFHIDGRGRTATTDDDAHIRDMIEQLLFTAPGERVNRPDFGSGLLQMVFAPNSPELAAAVSSWCRARCNSGSAT